VFDHIISSIKVMFAAALLATTGCSGLNAPNAQSSGQTG
jgi:hypothetical protein